MPILTMGPSIMRAISTTMLVLVLAMGPAAAALAPVTDPADLPAGSFSADFSDLAAGTSGPLTRLAGTPGELELAAPGGLFADGAGLLSTTFDADPITFTFTEPVPGFAIEGGIVGELFHYLDGGVEFSVGGESLAFDVAATGAAFAGVLSDTPFTSASVSILDFDTDASSAAFLGLESVTAVPVPAAAPLFATALAGLAAWARRRR